MAEDKQVTMEQMLILLESLRSYVQAHPGDAQARFVAFCAANLMQSPSQNFQDLFVLFVLDNKREGFFVEFGAANGLYISNSLLLERRMGWNGILAEPARSWKAILQASGRRATIDTRCVWSRSGEALTFNDTEDAMIATVNAFSDVDSHSAERVTGKRYEVETISLTDLLDFHNAPKVVDYLSIDTEGSELVILETFDFEKYQFNVITVEHNYTETERAGLFSLLTAKGYVRVFESFSGADDWYVHSSILNRSNG